jgi:hypothetical protein
MSIGLTQSPGPTEARLSMDGNYPDPANLKRYYKTDKPVLETNRIGFKIVNNKQEVSLFVKNKEW